MPEPIQSAVYQPGPETSVAGGCDPSVATCGPPPQGDQPRVVATEPVAIEGDAGAQALLRQMDADRCSKELGAIAVSCGAMVTSALTAVATAPTVIGLVGGAASTVIAGAACAYSIESYDACVDETQAWREASARCEAKDGTPLRGADGSTLVCLVER